MDVPVGFVGLGRMGEPMARNLVRAGTPLVVWNRSRRARDELAAEGAKVADGVDEVFDAASTVVLMLADGDVMDEVLGRGGNRFEQLVRDHILVHMGTTSPAYSRALADDVATAGGRYVEAPVSGSRKPAEAGRLVAMLAADHPPVLAELEPLWAPMCASTVRCGRVPSATLTKLAVNVYLIAMVTGLAEAFHFAHRHDVDLDAVRRVLDDGPMASDVSRLKTGMLVTADFGAQAAVADVHYNSRLVVDAARVSGIATPLLDVCEALYGEAEALGHGALDMVAVLRAIESRSEVAG